VLAVEPAEDGIMDQPPRRPTKRLIGRYLLFRIAFASCLLVAFTVGAVFWVINEFAPDAPIPVFNQAVADKYPGCPKPAGSSDEWCYYTNECNPWNGECVDQKFICENSPQVLSGGPERPFDATISTCANVVGRRVIRSQASNTLTLSAISVMLSARFAYQSGFHKRLLFGNKYAWYAALITLVLQLCITYIPGLNSIVFQMGPMDGKQWGVCILFVVLTFVCMEAEKAVMRYFKSKKMDTDDEGDGYVPPKEDITEPFVSTTSQRSAAMHTQLLHK
jgi:magnesium-transporting ATPase (P-type)